MAMATAILEKLKKRPFLIAGGVAGCSLYYMSRRQLEARLPEGEIWLDMDLSRPLSKSKPSLDLSALVGEPQALCVRDVVDALEMAAKDDRVRGVLGRFSYRSWGGGYLACVQELRDAISKFRDSAGGPAEDGAWGGERRRFTIAVADTFGEGGPAVGEYYLASAFEKILLQKSGYVGLTGSGTQQLFFKRFFEKYGVKPEVFAREEYKSAAESFTEKAYSEHNRKAMTTLLTGLLDDVADGVALSRGLEGRKDVLAIMQDCPLPAKIALSANLIDGIMYPHDAEGMVTRYLEGEPPLKALTPPPDTDTAAAETKALTDDMPTSIMAAIIGKTDDEETTGTRVPMSQYIKVMRAKEAKLNKATNAGKHVAIININGAITRHSGSGANQGQDQAATSNKLCKQLKKISEDPKVGAVVLRVDSGGGSAVASDSIAAAVTTVRRAGKPVVCSMGDLAASGGYMIAAACDKIVAQPTTITGSIGVVSLKVSIQRLLKKWDIEVDSIELTENHLAFSPFQEFTDKQRKVMDQRVGEIYEDFVSGVADGRKLSVQEVLEVAKGRVWTGRQALDRGLVDELGGLNSAVAIARKAAGLPEDTLAVTALSTRPTLTEIASRFMASGNVAELNSNSGLRCVMLALADALVGPETMASASSAISLLASINDVTNGKVPNRMSGARRGELEVDDVDMF